MLTLVLGGARSGKSELAERLVGRLAAAAGTGVTYVATATVVHGDVPGSDMPDEDMADEDLAERVAAHRARRPDWWVTVEPPPESVAEAVRRARGTVLVDGLGTWVAAAPGFTVETEALCSALQDRAGDSVVVSDEVGMGVHPSTEAGRRFRDALGLVNQAVAAVADEVLLVVAGRPLRLDPA